MNIKKIFLILIVALTTAYILTGCGVVNQPGIDEAHKEYRLVVLSNVYGVTENEAVLYDKQTKVMYIYYGQFQGGGLCPLYNRDGTIMLYEGKAYE